MAGKASSQSEAIDVGAPGKVNRTALGKIPDLADRRPVPGNGWETGNHRVPGEFPHSLQCWSRILHVIEETHGQHGVKHLGGTKRGEILLHKLKGCARLLAIAGEPTGQLYHPRTDVKPNDSSNSDVGQTHLITSRTASDIEHGLQPVTLYVIKTHAKPFVDITAKCPVQPLDGWDGILRVIKRIERGGRAREILFDPGYFRHRLSPCSKSLLSRIPFGAKLWWLERSGISPASGPSAGSECRSGSNGETAAASIVPRFVRSPGRSRRGEYKTCKAFSRSEEHTSELQSPCNLVCRLL